MMMMRRKECINVIHLVPKCGVETLSPLLMYLLNFIVSSTSSSFLLFSPIFGFDFIVSDYVIFIQHPMTSLFYFLDYDVIVSDDVSPSGL